MASENHNELNGVHKILKENISGVALVMVPLPAQGHINQLLHLSRLISAYDLPVHYVGTTTLILQAQSRVHDLENQSNIYFHHFSTPSFANPPPDPLAPIKFPTHMVPSFMAATHLRDSINTFVKELSTKHKRVVVIYDYFMSYVVQDIVSVPNAEAYSFRCSSAFTLFLYELDYDGGIFKHELQPEVAEMLKKAPPADGCVPSEFYEFWTMQREARDVSSGEIFNSNRGIEDAYFDLFAKQAGMKAENIWGLGPFNPISMYSEEKWSERIRSRHKCLQWLDKQEENSVIYISFGSTTSLSDEEIRAIAFGLEKSEQKFIWVLREADRGNIFEGKEDRNLDEILPHGFEQRVKEKGIIVRDWAPQLKILGHSATGGFLSHCGWNSCMESISLGVPTIAWPMHSDQPRNAVFLTQVLRIGVDVMDWKRRSEGEVVSSEAVETAVRTLMASEEGEKLRISAKQLGDAVRKSVMDCGATRKEMDSFISRITREK